MKLAGLLAVLAIAFSVYWFNPKIEADRAQNSMFDESFRASEHLQQVEEDDGLHSEAAKAVFANFERKVFVRDCITDKFKSNQTTLSEYRAIESDCEEKLMEKDIESHRTLGVDYGWEHEPG